MFHSPTRPSMDRPRFVTRILITPFVQGPLMVRLMRRFLSLLGFALISVSTWGQAFNCPSGFSSSGACKVTTSAGTGAQFLLVFGGPGSLSGSQLLLMPTGETHQVAAVNWQQAVNVQAFTSSFTFIPNGQNVAFVLNNNTNTSSGPAGQNFSSGAGCESGFFQEGDSATPPWPNHVFALELDSYSALDTSWNFAYSSAQIYGQGDSPCMPNDGAPTFYPINKVSTSPVPLDSPATTRNTTNGDIYSATLVYTGTNLTLNLYDVTAGGSCPGASCFTHTWQNVAIPSMVGSSTAWVGLTSATGLTSSFPLYINSFSYTALSKAATPTFSSAAGTYGSTQSVAISDSTGSSYICYNFTGAPSTNGFGGCTNGSLYSGAISVPTGRTVYAVAGVSGDAGDSAIGSASYTITGTASIPAFNQPGGTFNGNQTVQLTAAQGGVICYNTTGSPATNGSTGCTTGTHYTTPIVVSSNETIYATAGGTGFSDSAVGSAAYVISPFQAPTNSPTFSPLPGTYSGTQSVTLASTTSGANICYTLSATTPALLPQTDNWGGCLVGTLYNGPISVSSTQVLYAMAGTVQASQPSSLVQGAYTISPSGGSLSPAPPTLLGAQVH
jgi:hypothetical protein